MKNHNMLKLAPKFCRNMLYENADGALYENVSPLQGCGRFGSKSQGGAPTACGLRSALG